jgi:DNA repair photolyase
MTEFIEKEFKSILNKKKFIDSWFWDRYTINPYNGCSFGCVYCDSRSAKYHMPEDFENKIIIKRNVGKMLHDRIRRARTFRIDVVGMGGVTDCYQPAEKVYGNTRQCLEVMADWGYPIHMATKSTLVLRDLDILDTIGKNSWCGISLTITTVNKEIARFLDNRSPAPHKRLETLRQLKQKSKHIQAGVLLIPLIPYLCDSDLDLESLVQAVQDSGADYLLFGGGMTLRDQQALWFLNRLKGRFPLLVPKYERLYNFSYNPEQYNGLYSPSLEYLLPKHQKLFELCEKHRLPYRIKRYIPNDYRKTNYLIAEELLNESYRRQMLDKAWSNLFWAGQNIQNLSESLEEIWQRNELSKIRNVEGDIKNQIESRLKDVLQ